jgi:hypothetical protein
MKQCIKCNESLPTHSFRLRKENMKPRNTCRECERKYQAAKSTQVVVRETTGKPELPEAPTGDTLVKRMLGGARHRAKEKNLPFNLELKDIVIPSICPVLKIPLIPSIEGNMKDNSPTLDRHLPHLGYTKTNVTVISNLANRIKTNANSIQIEAVLKYVKQIEESA